ncbi:glycosyltransferase [Variovorax sp. J22R133]|uniref:glycosyltransferase n=1 Tax=Variovorax brevis TaxID=3053503 RepID=UPI002574A9EF|nr:glycosyltransferase [Variovorax sp. J22R133]MDM0114286.1 glycosyltransferase [Variovorax sp. J22R133]
MRFLHLIASVDPTGGGPIEGARHLHRSLVELGHTGEFVSLDADDAPWVQDFPTTLHALGPAKGRFGYSPALLPWLQSNAENFDAVIVNGLWQYHGLAAWRARNDSPTPYFVFPHGMLDPWFKRRYPLKHLKKWLYWPWAEYRVLRDANAVLFTCEEERLLARKSFWLYRCNEAIVSFGTSAPTDDAQDSRRVFLDAYPELQGKRLLLFLGRIHPKKGCDLLIEAFAKACRNTPDVHLVMAGPDQANWTRALQARAQQLGVADRVTWTGMLAGQLKWGAFRASEAFCLPSHQENFGIAVAEALACKCPVLISDKVNIWREIEAGHAGYVETDSINGTVALLERWLATPAPQWAIMREAALRCFDRNFRMDNVARTLVHVVQKNSPKGVSHMDKQSAHV